MRFSSTRWNLFAASETDEAVQTQVWELLIEQIKAKNASQSKEEIESIIDEALAWARRR
jgi:hypothetical protein